MRIIPNEARLELYGLQVLCASAPDIDYVDHIWSQRYTDAPKSKGAWPYRSVRDTPASNVTPIRKKRGG